MEYDVRISVNGWPGFKTRFILNLFHVEVGPVVTGVSVQSDCMAQ